MIRLESVSKTFGEKIILQDLSLEVKEHEILALLGPNGCGKSTALNMIAGLIGPSGGQIFIDGRLVNGRQGKKKIHVPPSARKLGYVFQTQALFPHMLVRDNIAYGLRFGHLSEQEIDSQTRKLLEFVGLTGFENHYPRQLSGGQKQRACLARSIAKNPKILLLDEPLSAVDMRSKESLRQAFKGFMRELKTTTIYVTHDLSEALIMADRIAILGNGRIEQIGTRDEVLSKPKSRFVAEFLGTNIYDGEVVSDESRQHRIKIAGVSISAPISNNAPGQALLVTIQPEDVILLSELDANNSIRADQTYNVLEGVILEILQMQSMVQVTVDVGFPIKTQITLRSFINLDLSEGKRVFIKFQVNVMSKCEDYEGNKRHSSTTSLD
jgi:ABC-type Fe3+/spermidine/putrescine transport system ATPase subunit